MVTTLAALATKFLERPGLSQSTIRSYEMALLPLLQQHGYIPVDQLHRQQLEDYLNTLSHLSYTTQNRHLATLRAMLNFAVERDYLASNPIARLKYRKPDRAKGERNTDGTIRYLTSEQLQLLYSYVEPNSRLHTLVMLLHQTGARIAEALALDTDEIDFENRKFQVIGKGNKTRWCYYGTDLADILEKYLRFYHHRHHPALFTARQPKTMEISRLTYHTAYRDWKSLVKQSPKLQAFRLHDLRHTFATERVGLMGIEELRALMGHANIQTTLRYQKVTSSRAEEVAKEALKALERES